MRSLPITTETYQDYLTNFVHWLQTLGYSVSTCYNLPNHLHEFFYYLEGRGLYCLDEATPLVIESFFSCLQSRGHQRKSGGLSVAYLQKYLQSLKKFSSYLQSLGLAGLTIPPLLFSSEKSPVSSGIRVLSTVEVGLLYDACSDDVTGLRDRALLSLYYGSGLRRSEGVRLNVWDVKFREGWLLVHSSKNGLSRQVPLAPGVCDALYRYLQASRPFFKHSKSDAAFLLGRQGRLSGQSALLRLKLLVARADLSEASTIGLHTLRHSVATHLLSGGMSLKNIALFLGHQSLESTQLYTHITSCDQ